MKYVPSSVVVEVFLDANPGRIPKRETITARLLALHRFDFPILPLISTAQSQNGLRHHDHHRYRKSAEEGCIALRDRRAVSNAPQGRAQGYVSVCGHASYVIISSKSISER